MDTLTVRPHWYSGPSLFGLSVVALCLVSGLFSHGAFGVALVMAVFWVYGTLGMKIEVTSADVRLSIWLRRSQSVPRDAITAMHWYGRAFIFVSDNPRATLKVGSLGWSRGQLLDLSEALGVRLYNHRTKRGFGRDAGVGQVIRLPARAK